jgi:hypothetical protein
MIPVVVFFSPSGGIGTTTLAYHLAWSIADLGVRVLAADLDPQAALSRAFLDDDRLEEVWAQQGDVRPEEINGYLSLLPGEPVISRFEADPSEWAKLRAAAEHSDAKLILVDLGPNLSLVNQAAVRAADFVVIPVAPDLFSVQCLHRLGTAIRSWRSDWDRAGYVVLQHTLRLDGPVQCLSKWTARIPLEYAHSITMQEPRPADRIGVLKDYGLLLPMAREARKPIFHLKPADGAMGAYLTGAHAAGKEFQAIARELLTRIGLGEHIA